MERRTFLNIGAAGLAAMTVAAPLRAQFIAKPVPAKGKWAVLFATWYGTTRDAAEWISEGMGGIADVFDVRQVPADLASYDNIVVGSAIQAFTINPQLKSYLEANASKLKGKIRGLYAVCGNLRQAPGPQQVEQYLDKILAPACQVAPTAVPKHVFGGRITKVLMEPDVYQGIVKSYSSMNIPTSDFDNLKRVECLQFGAEILAKKA